MSLHIATGNRFGPTVLKFRSSYGNIIWQWLLFARLGFLNEIKVNFRILFHKQLIFDIPSNNPKKVRGWNLFYTLAFYIREFLSCVYIASSSEAKNAWSFPCTPPHVFIITSLYVYLILLYPQLTDMFRTWCRKFRTDMHETAVWMLTQTVNAHSLFHR